MNVGDAPSRMPIRDGIRERVLAVRGAGIFAHIDDEAATLLASEMSEKKITDVAAFFESPSGKKYVSVTPIFLQRLADVTTPWRDKLSTDIVTRARQEMKKKGVEF